MPNPEPTVHKFELILTFVTAPRDEFPDGMMEVEGLVMGKDKAVSSVRDFAANIFEKSIPHGHSCSILARARELPLVGDDTIETQLRLNIATLEKEVTELKKRIEYLGGERE